MILDWLAERLNAQKRGPRPLTGRERQRLHSAVLDYVAGVPIAIISQRRKVSQRNLYRAIDKRKIPRRWKGPQNA